MNVPPPPPAAPADPRQAIKKPADDQSKITLLLHPAPKAAPVRRKKESRPLTAKEALRAKVAKRTGTVPTAKSDAAPTERARSSAAELDRAWIGADAAGAADALAAAGAAADDLVQAWLEQNNVGALTRAAALEKIPGPARKAARRALNVLKSRGIDIPKQQATTGPSEGAAVEAFVASFVPPDPAGGFFLSISQRQPGGRYRVADAVIREPEGVVHASSGAIPLKQIKRWRKRIEERYGAAPVEVPVDWARYRIAAARKLNDTSKHLVPLGFDSCAPLFHPVPMEEVAHPLADLEAGIGDADVQDAKPESQRLHDDPAFRSWLPERDAIDELLTKVGERIGEDGVKDSAIVDEALRVELAAATDRYFTPELRQLLAERMRDSAISVRQREGDAAAKRVLAVARAVRDAGLITSPPSELPFLARFFQKAIAVLVHQGRGQLQIPVPRKPSEEQAE